MRNPTVLASLLTALFTACSSGPPPVCEEVRACCERLNPALAASCQSSFEQAAELESERAAMQCEAALAGLRLAGQCQQDSDGGTNSTGADAGPTDVSVLPNLPPAQGLSQPCDPSYGLDACGASLFCAAFDGRTIPTCYPEGIRASGESCAENRHCQTGRCDETARRCRAGDGQSCEPGLGCASEDQYCSVRQGHCQLIGSGESGEACGLDGHCDSGLVCRSERCDPSREEGSPCSGPSGCNRPLECVFGRCDWGRGEGSGCRASEHCESGLICEANVCQRAPGGACTIAQTECRPGEYCQLTSITPEEAMCIPEGPARRGEVCHQGQACSGGTTCLAFEDMDGRCFAPCDPQADGACGEGWECIQFDPLSFGICLALRCSPFSCGANEVCDQTFELSREELLGCAPAGTTPIGGACSSSRCAAPGFCIDFGPGPRCATPCDQDHACPSGTCVWLSGASFGVCDG